MRLAATMPARDDTADFRRGRLKQGFEHPGQACALASSSPKRSASTLPPLRITPTRCPVNSRRALGRRKAKASRRLDHDFQAIGEHAHALDEPGVGDGENVGYVAPNDLEGMFPRLGLGAVGDGPRNLDAHDGSLRKDRWPSLPASGSTP